MTADEKFKLAQKTKIFDAICRYYSNDHPRFSAKELAEKTIVVFRMLE